MNPNPIPDPDQTEIREGDILFDCPHCGKTMAIEAASASAVVPCAACGRDCQCRFPMPPRPRYVAAVAPALDNGESPEEPSASSAPPGAAGQADRPAHCRRSLQGPVLSNSSHGNTARYERIAAELAALGDAPWTAPQLLLAEARAAEETG